MACWRVGISIPLSCRRFRRKRRQEPCNSLGLRSDNEVVGWMITHRTRPDTIQYTSLYVEPAVRRRQPGIGMALLAKSICLQIESGVPRGIFLVHMDNPQGLNLTRRHLGALSPVHGRDPLLLEKSGKKNSRNIDGAARMI